MKKFTLIMAMIVFLAAVPAVASSASPIDSPNESAYILIEASTGQVLAEHNADESIPPVSLTKIMLILLIAEEINAGRLSLTDTVVASAHASGAGGSVIWLEPGEEMSVDDLLRAVIIASSNDAAIALAEHVGGSEEAFVQLMNSRAYTLGMTNTNFTNTAGFDAPEHYTTARDIAVMSRALMREENYAVVSENLLTRVSAVRIGTERETQLVNTNKMITYYKGIEGLKTGRGDPGGYCISAAAKRGGMRLISVVTGCKDEDERLETAEQILDYGFANYEMYHPALEPPENIRIINGVQRELAVAEEHGLKSGGIVIPKGRSGDMEYEVYLPEKITAPIQKNQPVGNITATLDGKVVYEGYFIAVENADELTFWKSFLIMIKRFFTM